MFVICCHPPADFPNGFGPYETRKAAREALETAGFTMYQSHEGGYFAKDECEDTFEIVEIMIPFNKALLPIQLGQ